MIEPKNKPDRNQILINATEANEVRVALIKANTLHNLDIDRADVRKQKGNIYLARITSIANSLGACFVDYGADRHGFLPFKDITPSIFKNTTKESGEQSSPTNFEEKLYEGQEILVQVDKEQRSNKGAALTTFVTLPGSFLIVMPKNPRAGGISKRIEGDERIKLKEMMGMLKIPENMGVIIRTAGIDKSLNELQWDLDLLCAHWTAIDTAAKKLKAPCLIYQEHNIIIRALRDYLRQDIEEILIDNPNTVKTVKEYLQQVQPSFVDKVTLYEGETPLFHHAHIEDKIATIFQHEVSLPSGASLVIDHTEALVTIDVNSARATKGESIEETALQTNLEAAEEITRQLRLRDIGGLIVIDFIDMLQLENQRSVENRLRDAFKVDRARIQIGRISKRFGLLEMSRQRLRSNLSETSLLTCPRCKGRGMIYGIEQFSTLILRHLTGQAVKARKEGKNIIQIQIPTEVATFLFNEKRAQITHIESSQQLQIIIIPNPYFNSPRYKIKLLKNRPSDSDEGETGGHQSTRPSYKLIEAPSINLPYSKFDRLPPEEPAVKLSIGSPRPMPKQKKLFNRLVTRLWNAVFGENKKKSHVETTYQHRTRSRSPNRQRSQHNRYRSTTRYQPQHSRHQRFKTTQGSGQKSHSNERKNQDT